MTDTLPWTESQAGLRLAVRVTPKAARIAFGGLVAMPDGRTALAVRIAALPAEGEANLALVAALAKTLGISKSAVTIASGAASRHKLVGLSGDPAALTERLRYIVA